MTEKTPEELVLEKVKDAANAEIKKGLEAHRAEFEKSTGTVTAQFEQVKASVKSVDDKIAELGDQVKAIASRHVTSIESLGLSPKDKKEMLAIGMGKMLAGMCSSMGPQGEVKALLDATREKAMTAGAGVDGGNFIPIETAGEFIPMLYDLFDLAMMGITTYNPTGAQFEIRKGKSATTVGWIGEAQTTPVGQPTLGMLTLRPKLLAGRIIVSRRMAEAGSGAFAQYVMGELMSAMSEELSNAVINGTGTDYSPMGILKIPGITTLATGENGDNPTGKFLSQLVGIVEDAKALPTNGRGGFLSHTAIIRKIKDWNSPQYSGDTEGMNKFDPFMSNQALANRIGHNIAGTTLVGHAKAKGNGTALGDLIFGNWLNFILCKWGSLMIETTREGGTAWANHEMQIKATTEVDCGIKRTEGFAIAPFCQGL